MQAEDNRAAGRLFQAQALRPDRHTSVGADLDQGAHAPHIAPPRAAGDRSQHRTVFLFGLVPGPLWGLAQFAMDFAGVVVRPQGINVQIGQVDFIDLFAGEVGGQPALPELVFAFDFTLGLRGGGVAQADVVELQGPAQLSEGVGVLGEKEAVVIDIELEGPSVGQKGSGQEVEIGEEEFALIEFGAGEQAAAIIEHVEHGEGEVDGGEPAIG